MAQYYTILTAIGRSKIANSQVLGTKVEMTQLAVGDSASNPNENQTQLRNEVWRGNISLIAIDDSNPSWIVIEAIIPSDVGGFNVREVGVFDIEGDLIAVGKYPDTYKPVLSEGSAKDLYLRMIIEVSNASAVTLRVDPSVIIASRKYVDDAIRPLKAGIDENTKKIIEAEANAKAYTDQQIQLVTETGIPKLVTYPYVLTATTDGQTDFAIPLETFDKDTDTVMVIQNSSVVSPVGYTVADRTVRLVEGVEAGTELFIQVFKNVPIGPEGAINGGVLAINSVPSDRVQGFNELFTSVSDGKAQLETAITDKDGTVSKVGEVATFDELDTGIRSIPQAKGNAARTDVLAGKTFSSEVAGIEQTGTMPYRTGNVTGKSISRSGTTLRIKPQTGYVDDTSNVQWNDPNWLANNIRQGVSIFGLPGNLIEGKRWANGVASFPSSTLEIRGLSFKPSCIIVNTNSNTQVGYAAYYVDPTIYPTGSTRTIPINVAIRASNYNEAPAIPGSCTIYDDGFSIGVQSFNNAIWFAFE